ncbi:MAG: sulfatase-like hydrolase/transferase [Clostridiales bacterium]|nr:sulfatase-like hydrolase/transferase [Clostridiales bacterium]
MARRKKKKRGAKVKVRTDSLQKSVPQILAAQEMQKQRPGPKKILAAFFVVIFLALAALLTYNFLLAPGADIKKDSSLNVLLVTLDTTRADRLGCYGYEKAKTPNLDALAASGVQFLNAYCQVPLTTPSHCSILTGTYPLYHQVHNNGSYALPAGLTTLAEVLKEKGFKTAAFVSSFTVDSRFGLAQGFDVYDDRFAEGQAFKALNSERKAEDVFAVFFRWLRGSQAQPFFCWVHFFDPHLPYNPPPPFKEEFADDLYDGEIAYMDYCIGKTIGVLRERNLMARTLVILAGDHGEAFGEKAEVGHGVFLYDGTMKVPLIFCAENHLPAGAVVKSRVRLIDIMPTVLDMLNVPVHNEVQGTSLLPHILGKKKEDLSSYIETYFPRENYGWSELVGLLDGDWKYIKAPKEEMYNLKDDPEETKNAVLEKTKIVREKRARLGDIIKNFSSGIQSERRELTTEEKERLRSLGYVSELTEVPRGPLPDPKDMLEELRMNQEAELFELEENYAEAAKIYEKILALRPDTPTSYINLALMNARMEKFEEAIRILESGTARIPGSEVLLARLAHTYMIAGRPKKALDAWQAVLVISPGYFDGLLASGWILDFMGNKEEARGYYEKAMEVEPENKFLRKKYALNLATTGKIKEAIELYERLKAEYPDDYEVLQDLGIAYGYAGDLSRSIENLERAVSLHATPTAYYNLAVASRKAGKIGEAVRYIKLYLADPEGESEEKIATARQELINLERLLKQ